MKVDLWNRREDKGAEIKTTTTTKQTGDYCTLYTVTSPGLNPVLLQLINLNLKQQRKQETLR